MTVDKPAFEIPTIDIGPYLRDPSSPEAAEIVRRVRDACMTTGFFSLVGHNISRELRDKLFNAAEKLFALPLDVKKSLKPAVLKNRGYELIGSQALQEGALPDLKEGYYVGKDIPAEHPQTKSHPYLIGPNIFPDGIADEELKEPSEQYYDEAFELSLKVLEILARGLPYGDDIFEEFVSNDAVCSLRLLHYPPQTSKDARQLGAGAHTDFGAITLLLQDSSGGLEVLNQGTGEWIPVEPNPDAYVVNIGDMLSLWTKNVYKSNVHRVINKSTKDRYSMPFFFDGNADLKLVPFDGSEPVGGKVLTVEEHMLERFGTTYGRAEKAAA